jgi:NTE family protein
MPTPRTPSRSPLALIMSGGGARAAYQVGVLRAIAKEWPDFYPSIITGVSAGAINAVALAARQKPFAQSVGLLSRLWSELTTEQVFRADASSLAGIGAQWVRQLGSGGRTRQRQLSLVDTQPLRETIARVVGEDGGASAIERNIFAGKLDAFGITATNYGTGVSVTWVQGKGISSWGSGEQHSIRTGIGVEHIMASAALPLAFPAVFVGGAWFGDGGIRQIAPLSPGLYMGADRILAVNTRHVRTAEQSTISAITDYPPPAQIIGVLMNAVFLDSMDRDANTLRRISRLVQRLPDDQRDGMRPVEIMVLRPSQDLARLAAEFEVDLPGPIRFLMRGLGTGDTEAPDWLSMLLFEPAYLQRVMDIGEHDAYERIDELSDFLDLPRPKRARSA